MQSYNQAHFTLQKNILHISVPQQNREFGGSKAVAILEHLKPEKAVRLLSAPVAGHQLRDNEKGSIPPHSMTSRLHPAVVLINYHR